MVHLNNAEHSCIHHLPYQFTSTVWITCSAPSQATQHGIIQNKNMQSSLANMGPRSSNKRSTVVQKTQEPLSVDIGPQAKQQRAP